MTEQEPESNGTESVEWPELPKGWSAWSGEVSTSYYTLRFGTDYRRGGDLVRKGCIGGYEGEVFWNRGQKHIVCLYPIEGVRDDGDPEVSEYADIFESFDSKQEAVSAIPRLINELKEKYG